MAHINLPAPFTISNADDDARVYRGASEPSEQASDVHQIRNTDSDERQTGENRKAVGRSGNRSRPLHGRENLRHGQQGHVAARRLPGYPAKELSPVQSSSRQLQPFAREPGGRFDSFNTLPSGTDGSDFVAKLVLYGE